MTRSTEHSSAVIFDLDGTLIDSVEDIANAVNDVLRELDFPTHDIEFYKQNIGGGINDLIQSSLPKDHSVEPEAYIERLDHFYIDHLNKTHKCSLIYMRRWISYVLKRCRSQWSPTSATRSRWIQ